MLHLILLALLQQAPIENESLPADVVSALAVRDASVKRVSFLSVTRGFEFTDVLQAAGETDADYLHRCFGRKLDCFTTPEYPIYIARDFESPLLYAKVGVRGHAFPRYEEFLQNGDQVSSLIATAEGALQATVGEVKGSFGDEETGFPRFDVIAFRPIGNDTLLSAISATSSKASLRIPDPFNRKTLTIESIADDAGAIRWTVSLRHLRPTLQRETSQPVLAQTWQRAFIETVANEPRVTRIDLMHDGSPNARPSLPARVWLLRDFRIVGKIAVPHEMVTYTISKRRVRGELTVISDIRTNDDVLFPGALDVPANTLVNNLTLAKFGHRGKIRSWLIGANVAILTVLFMVWARRRRPRSG